MKPGNALLSFKKRKKLFRVMHLVVSWIHVSSTGLEVIKLEFILGLKIKRSDWLLADACPQAANHCALF